MGASVSCSIFDQFSTALQWILITKCSVPTVSHILDDFIFIAPSHTLCQSYLDTFLCLSNNLGIPINDNKTVLPGQVVQLHGLQVNTSDFSLTLPPDKLSDAMARIQQVVRRKSISLRDLQSIIGLLAFACKAIYPGRTFLRRLIDLTKGASAPHRHIRLTREARKDLHAWLHFLQHFNGVTLCLNDKWLSSSTIKLFSDASNAGYSIIFGSSWFAAAWPPSWRCHHITIKELFPIVMAIEAWGPLNFLTINFCFYAITLAVVTIINKLTSKDTVIMSLVRRLVLATLKFNVLVRAKHIPGKTNVVADKLSRLSFQDALRVAPWLDRYPTDPPPECLPS